MRKYTEEKRRSLINQIDLRRAEGVNRIQAIKEAKISVASYSIWKRALAKKPSVIVHDAPEKKTYKKKGIIPTSGRCFVIVTDTANLSNVLRGVI